MWDARDELEVGELHRVSYTRSGSLHAASISFWLDFLEELNGDEADSRFGAAASALHRAPSETPDRRVMDIRRDFPLQYSARPIELLQGVDARGVRRDHRPAPAGGRGPRARAEGDAEGARGLAHPAGGEGEDGEARQGREEAPVGESSVGAVGPRWQGSLPDEPQAVKAGPWSPSRCAERSLAI